MKPFQARAARAILQLAVREVATLAAVSPNTITRIEGDEAGIRGPNAATVQAIKRVYEERGIVFLEDGDVTGGGPGVRMVK